MKYINQSIWSITAEQVMSDLNLMWEIWIWCERFEFDVSDLNLMGAIWIWCERFEFDVWIIIGVALVGHESETRWHETLNHLAWNRKPFPIPIVVITRKHIARLNWTNRDFFWGITNIYLYTRSHYRKESAAWRTKWSPNMLLKNSGCTLILYL